MNSRSQAQLPSAVVMVRPTHFGFNPETSETNVFQKENTELSRLEIQRRAKREFDLMAGRLRLAGASVYVVEDRETPASPDAVFPNNWTSSHADGTVVLYPMCSPLRRLERRKDVVQMLEEKGYRISRVLDLSHHETEGRYLEGTGSIVFDHVERCAYANLSPRTDPVVIQELCETIGYSRITFRALDQNGQEIYHTNVMMSIGDGFAVVCTESIRDSVERRLVVESLEASHREIVAINYAQLRHFCANILQIKAGSGTVIAMSTEACLAFDSAQRKIIEKYGRIVESPIPMIESVEGGSARCMLADVHLPRSV
jgi:hypothetical protein